MFSYLNNLKRITVRLSDARFLGKEKTRAAHNFCNFCYLTRHFFVRHTLSEMENFKFQFYVAY